MEDKKFKKVNSPEQFGKIDTKIKTVVISDNYTSYLYVKEEDMAKIKNGMQVELNNNENIFEIADIEETPEKVTDDMDEYARHLGNFQVGEWVYKCRLNKSVKEGTYSANVVIESIAPMTFIIN